MKINLSDGSYISFNENINGIALTMAGKKPDDTYTASSYTLNKKQIIDIAKFLVNYLEENSHE